MRPGRAKGANGTSGARPQRPREPHSAALVAHSILTRCWHLALGTARWSRSFVCPRQGSAAGAHVAWKGSPASPLGAIGRGQCCQCHPPSIPQAPVFPFLVEQAAWQLPKKMCLFPNAANDVTPVALGRVSSFWRYEAERCSNRDEAEKPGLPGQDPTGACGTAARLLPSLCPWNGLRESPSRLNPARMWR